MFRDTLVVVSRREESKIEYISTYLKANKMFRDTLVVVSGREESKIEYISTYLKANKMFRDFTNSAEDPVFSQV